MQTIQTTCPHCQSRFQLTSEQINVAQGQVRCGTCLEIFQAIPLAEKTILATALDEDDQLFSDAEDELPPINPHLTPNFDSMTPQADAFGALETEEKKTDESWAEALLDDTFDEPSLKKDPSSANPKAASLSEQLGDLDSLDIPVNLSIDADNATEDSHDSKQDFIERIEPAPVEFVYQKPRKWIFSVLFFLLSLILCGLLTGQFLYFQFDKLSQNENLRPVYNIICEQFDCPAPQNFDVNNISANHASIQSHPYFQNILIVNTVLTNHALQKQPFPAVSIVFTDINQKPIAGRKLQPNDYLQGAINDKKWIPSKQPVHIAIEIADIGDRAVGFYIELTEPRSISATSN